MQGCGGASESHAAQRLCSASRNATQDRAVHEGPSWLCITNNTSDYTNYDRDPDWQTTHNLSETENTLPRHCIQSQQQQDAERML